VQSITHDLRTPLASITALASALRVVEPLSVDQEELVASIEDQSTRLARLVDQVLDLSRIDGGVLQPRLATLAVDELIRAAVDASADPEQVLVSIEPDPAPGARGTNRSSSRCSST